MAVQLEDDPLTVFKTLLRNADNGSTCVRAECTIRVLVSCFSLPVYIVLLSCTRVTILKPFIVCANC